MRCESESEVAQSCPTLCDPVDCSPPGSSVHGILQARIMEWVAISFSREVVCTAYTYIYPYTYMYMSEHLSWRKRYSMLPGRDSSSRVLILGSPDLSCEKDNLSSEQSSVSHSTKIVPQKKSCQDIKFPKCLEIRTVWTKQQRRQWQPTPVLLPGKSHGQRSLVGCSPWGREKSYMTEATSQQQQQQDQTTLALNVDHDSSRQLGRFLRRRGNTICDSIMWTFSLAPTGLNATTTNTLGP